MSYNKFLLVVGGLAGSGSTTFCKFVKEFLETKGLKGEFIYVGKIFRELAKKNNLDLIEFQKEISKNPNKEKEIDKKVFEEGLKKIKNEDFIIIEGKIQPYLFKNVYKIPKNILIVRFWIESSLEISAKRVSLRENIPYNIALNKVKEREKDNKRRYKVLYNINYPIDVKLASDFSINTDFINDINQWKTISIELIKAILISNNFKLFI